MGIQNDLNNRSATLDNLIDKLNPKNLQSEHSELFRQFSKELSAWGNGYTEPPSADQDIRYFLTLRAKRLKDRNLQVNEELQLDDLIVSNKSFMNAFPALKGFDIINFSKNNNHASGIRHISYYRAGTKVYDKTYDVTFTQTILEPTNANKNIDKLPYVCDNCGNVTTVGELTKACPYCNTSYEINNLFPRINNYWFLPNIADHEINNIYRFNKVVSILAVITFLIYSLIIGKFGFDSIFVGILLGLIAFIISFIITRFYILFKLTKYAASSGALYLKSKGSSKKIIKELSRFDSAFTYEYFEAKLISLIRNIILHPKWDESVQYKGAPLPEWTKSVLDIHYRGALSFNYIEDKGNCIEVGITLFTTITNDIDTKVAEKNQDIFVRMQHKKGFLASPVFSIKKISCKYCASSFDATREKFCPYCRQSYDLSEEDWIVTEIK